MTALKDSSSSSPAAAGVSGTRSWRSSTSGAPRSCSHALESAQREAPRRHCDVARTGGSGLERHTAADRLTGVWESNPAILYKELMERVVEWDLAGLLVRCDD